MKIIIDIDEKLLAEALRLGDDYEDVKKTVEEALKLFIQHQASKQPTRIQKRAREGWAEALIKAGAQYDKTPAFMGDILNEADKDWIWDEEGK